MLINLSELFPVEGKSKTYTVPLEMTHFKGPDGSYKVVEKEPVTMRVLCSDNCKGICNRCGTNLNRGTCDCDNRSLDPRMSVIQDIFKQLKEV